MKETVATMEVFVTKYLFTKGIESRKIWKPNPENGLTTDADDPWFQYEKKDWHETWEEALARAQEMKAKRIKSLEKQLKKTRELTFVQGAL